MTQIKDNNGLVSVGISVTTKFDGLTESYTVLCYSSDKKIPDNLDQWLDEGYLQDVGCESNQNKLDIDQPWQSISLDLLTCDLLCHESVDGEEFVFEKSDLLVDEYLFKSELSDFVVTMAYVIPLIIVFSIIGVSLFYIYRRLR